MTSSDHASLFLQDANVKLIRELREEIEKLRKMLSTTNQVYFS